MKRQSIIYVNFAPYENSGRILDYLKESFSLVILFSFDFHRLNKRSQSNRIFVFTDSSQTEAYKLRGLPTPESLLFLTLPFIAIVIFIQMLWYMLKFKKAFGKFDYYLTVNAFTAWIGNLLLKTSFVKKTVFWVWDYYPPGFPDWKIRLARWTYWRFDKWSTNSSTRVVFLNRRLMELRRKMNILPKRKKFQIVPIGTDLTELTYPSNKKLGHLGVLKKGQGLDLLIDNLQSLRKKVPDLKVEIIGSGPDEEYFRKKLENYKNVRFFGFIKNDNKLYQIIKGWSIGLATYRPGMSNESAWTDPSKIKAYISQGVPVITTNVTDFSKEITKYDAGIVVDYYAAEAFLQSVYETLKKNRKKKIGVSKLAKKYYFRKIYSDLFP